MNNNIEPETMNYTTIVILAINQLLIHVICLVIVEIMLFYFIIKPNTTSQLHSFFDIIKNKDNATDGTNGGNVTNLKTILDRSGVSSISLVNMKKYTDEAIDDNNKNILFIIIILLMSLFLALFISYYITGNFEYNMITTISSLIISVPIQLVYMYEFNLKNNPRMQLVIKKKFYEAIISYIDSL